LNCMMKEVNIKSIFSVSKIKVLTALILAFFLMLLFGENNLPPEIISISSSKQDNEGIVNIFVSAENKGDNKYYDTWCIVSEDTDIPEISDSRWQKMEKGNCSFPVTEGTYHVFVKDGNGNVTRGESQQIKVDRVVSVNLQSDKLFLAPGAARQLSAEVIKIGETNFPLEWKSSDANVVEVSQEGNIKAVGIGTATITAKTATGIGDEVDVTVTDLIILPSNEYKAFIPAYYYSTEEARLMDEILFSRVKEAGGYGTRGGVLAAARFITLEMPYMIPYFYENGRMKPHPGRPICDGEGRYYHVGLYLSEEKYKDIKVSVAGPAFWGAPLTNFQNEGFFTRGNRYPNGLSCSGFVSWAMLNGGIETGDIGAGDYPHIDYEFSDMGVRQRLTRELIRSGEIKPGDLIGKDGHIAIIVGIDDTYISIAESYFRGVQTVVFTIDSGMLGCEEYDYVINLDHIYDGEYNGQGVYEDVWYDYLNFDPQDLSVSW